MFGAELPLEAVQRVYNNAAASQKRVAEEVFQEQFAKASKSTITTARDIGADVLERATQDQGHFEAILAGMLQCFVAESTARLCSYLLFSFKISALHGGWSKS